jgi:ribosomal subunit interface protein
MDMIFKGRHTSVQERFRQHAVTKLAKIEKLDHKAIRIDVEVSKERNPRQSGRSERVELTIRSRGPAIRAEAAADDRYTALDLAYAKLESRLRRSCDRRKERSGDHATVRLAGVQGGPPAPGWDGYEPEPEPEPGELASEPPVATPSADSLVPIPMEGNGPLVVREKFHAAVSMTIDQALFEMELVGHDFYLFRDGDCGQASVVYRRRGYQYGVIRLVEG